jgi:hypothetical protein
VYNCLICLNFDQIMQAIDQDSQKNLEEPDSLKSDLLQIITNLIKDGGDD